MRDNYDFSKARKNPYIDKLEPKRQISIRLDEKTIAYFQGLSAKLNMPYQSLINSFLQDCVKRKLEPTWVSSSDTPPQELSD
ncbi:MAG: BrnA antitoxin family protein [Myxococcota bacterium]|nr:BrnA antitoxin family protein [Myxococcota bacterium]